MKLRLLPRNDISPTANCTQRGELFYDNTGNQMYLCDGSIWTSIGSLWEKDVDAAGAFFIRPKSADWDVAIGSDQAEAKLDVRGGDILLSSASDATLTLETNGSPAVELKDNSTSNAWIIQAHDGSYLSFLNGSPLMVIKNSPMVVGIATETPDLNYKLDVNGSIWAKNIWAQRVTFTGCSTTGRICTKTISFPANRFTSSPTVFCSAGPNMRGAASASPYSGLMCTVSSVSPSSVTISIGNNKSTTQGFDGNKNVNIIAFEP